MEASKGNPVTSFEAGIIISSGLMVGMCIKWTFYDRSERLTHWSVQELDNLLKAIEYYGENGGHDNFMFKLKENPELENSLPERHPYNTLLSEIPKLSEPETGTSTAATKVKECAYKDRGPTFELSIAFENNSNTSLFLHEYTAFSIFGYLRQMIDGFKKMSSHEGGIQ